jgi:hypothetical protein
MRLRNGVGAALIVVLALVLLLSPRHWVLSDQRRAVAHIADLPANDSALTAQLAQFVDWGGVHVPREPSKAVLLYRLLARAGRVPPAKPAPWRVEPRYGVSIREWSFLGMPFGWWREWGPVLYAENRYELMEAPLGDAGVQLLNRRAGRDLAQGFVFPFWAHGWGWLYLAGVAWWGWLYHRGVVRRRAELGLI